MGVDRTASGTLTRWDDRQAELQRLARITDPGEFARATANNQFGSIDVFVMHGAGPKTWNAIQATFRPEQFDPKVWTVVQGLPSDTVVAIRKP